MKILFLAPYPAYESPSQRYRFEHYLNRLQEQGITYSYQPFLGKRAWQFFFLPGHYLKKTIAVFAGYVRRWGLMFTIGKYDYVYVHREAAPAGPPVFEWIIAKLYRKKMIFDFDDAIWVPVVSQSNRVAKFIKWPSKVASICRMSYRVSAGNHFLADYARKYCSNVTVVPTVVDTDKVHNKIQDHETDTPVVGWTGTFSTLKYLNIVLPAIKTLQERYPFQFVVIANKNPELPLKNYRFITWRKETEIEDLLSMHIGLMPLTDGDIEKGKCGFKAIQYLSLGIPAVVSPVGANTDIVEDEKNGYHASSVREWEEMIEKLLNDKMLRKQLGNAGREKIVTAYSINSTFNNFISLFSQGT